MASMAKSTVSVRFIRNRLAKAAYRLCVSDRAGSFVCLFSDMMGVG